MYGFGDRLKKIRTERNMTQLEIANRLDVTKSMVSCYENETRFPSFDVLIKISQIFNVTTDYLFGLDRKKIIDVSKLTDKQVVMISELIQELEELNHQSKNKNF